MEIANSDRWIEWRIFSIDLVTRNEKFIKKCYEPEELAEFIRVYTNENIHDSIVVYSNEFGMGR